MDLLTRTHVPAPQVAVTVAQALRRRHGGPAIGRNRGGQHLGWVLDLEDLLAGRDLPRPGRTVRALAVKATLPSALTAIDLTAFRCSEKTGATLQVGTITTFGFGFSVSVIAGRAGTGALASAGGVSGSFLGKSAAVSRAAAAGVSGTLLTVSTGSFGGDVDSLSRGGFDFATAVSGDALISPPRRNPAE